MTLKPLPRPQFLSTSPQELEAHAIALYEELTQRVLYPGQAERLLLNLVVYLIAELRISVQWGLEQNLAYYALGSALDHLGALVGSDRLSPAPAQTTLRFTLGTSLATNLVIPAGTRARAAGSNVIFATNRNETIAAGDLSVDAIATAQAAGVLGNGFGVGSITQLLDPIPGAALNVSNLSITTGGADTESDEAYRERVMLAPAQFSVAGSEASYRYHVLTFSQQIVDVAIVMPFLATGGKQRVYVDIYILTADGLPTPELVAELQAFFDGEPGLKIRPIADIVTVKTPTEATYTITANVTALASASVSEVQANVTAALHNYIEQARSRLGVDIVDTQIIGAIAAVEGVYDVELVSPASDIVVAGTGWANHTGTLTVTIVGTADG